MLHSSELASKTGGTVITLLSGQGQASSTLGALCLSVRYCSPTMISREKGQTKQGIDWNVCSTLHRRLSSRRLVEMEEEIRLLTGGTAGAS